MVMMMMIVMVVALVVVLMVAIVYSLVVTMSTILHLRKTWLGWYSNFWFERISWSYPRRFRKSMRSWTFMSTSLQINPCTGRESTNLFIHSCPHNSIWCRIFRRVFLMVFVETWTVSQLRMSFHVRQRRLSKTLLLSACRLSRHPYDNKCVLWCLFGRAERSKSRTFYSILLTLNQQNWFTGKANNRRFSKIWFR